MKHDNKTVDSEGFLLVKDSWYSSNFTGKVKRQSGTRVWFKNGLRHRNDGPAVEYIDGAKSWYKDGKVHREDGPAIEWSDGSKSWYKDGQPHRDDGPAVEYPDGRAEWWYEGVQGLEHFPQELKKNLARRFLHEA